MQEVFAVLPQLAAMGALVATAAPLLIWAGQISNAVKAIKALTEDHESRIRVLERVKA